MKNYSWKNNGTEVGPDGTIYVDGQHRLHYSDRPFHYNFSIDEVAICYQHWSEEERQLRFKGAKFVWSGCEGGVGYNNHLMQADNIDDAKKEFEDWYEHHLATSVANLKAALAAAEEDYASFKTWRNSHE